MREVTKVIYETVVESDINQEYIYAFRDNKDIVFLCRKNDKFFWKCMCAVNMVWYNEYQSIEKAIEGVLKVKEYQERKCSPITEFESTLTFINWAHQLLNNK